MSYAVYFRYNGTRYKLPVNPEEIKRTRSVQIETYQVLGTGQISIPSRCNLEEISFDAEFPSTEYHYVETSGKFRNVDYYEKMLRKAQRNLTPVRFIASNGETDDISMSVIVKSVESAEKAGEEGDKYLSIKLSEYKGTGKRYTAVQTSDTEAVKEEQPEKATNPAVTENKTHTVVKGDTLWALAKTYYGSGSAYSKIVAANPDIKNPNLIYPGQVFNIPA